MRSIKVIGLLWSPTWESWPLVVLPSLPPFPQLERERSPRWRSSPGPYSRGGQHWRRCPSCCWTCRASPAALWQNTSQLDQWQEGWGEITLCRRLMPLWRRCRDKLASRPARTPRRLPWLWPGTPGPACPPPPRSGQPGWISPSAGWPEAPARPGLRDDPGGRNSSLSGLPAGRAVYSSKNIFILYLSPTFSTIHFKFSHLSPTPTS